VKLSDINIIDLLPPSIADDENVKAMAESLTTVFRETTGYIPSVLFMPRIDELTDEALIDNLAWQFHVDFYEQDMPLEMKRELVSRWLDWHTRKGTPSVIEEIVTVVFADATVTEWFDYDGEPYHFRVDTELPDVTAENIQRLIRAIFSVKNTRSWLDGVYILRHGTHTVYAGAAMEIARTIDVKQPLRSWEIVYGRYASWREVYEVYASWQNLYKGIEI